MFYHSGVEWFLLLEVKYVKIILYIMYYYISYLCLCLLIILGWYKTVKKMLKTLLTSVDLMYSQTSVSCRLDLHLFWGINWPVTANKVIICFTRFVPSSSTKSITVYLSEFFLSCDEFYILSFTCTSFVYLSVHLQVCISVQQSKACHKVYPSHQRKAPTTLFQ